MTELDDDLVEDLRSRLRADPSILHKNRALFERVAVCCAEDGSQWDQVRAVLREAKVLRNWEKKIRIASRELQGVRSIGGDPAPTSELIHDVWDGAPVSRHAEVPRGWGISKPNTQESAIYQNVERTVDGMTMMRRIPVSYDPVLIRRIIMHTEQSKIMLELAWKSGNRWHRGTYDREVVFSKSDIVHTASDGLPVRSDNAMEMVKFLGAYEYHNRRFIDHDYASSSMGWKGTTEDPTSDGFICGSKHMCRTESSKRFVLKPMGPGDKEEAETVRSVGKFEAWKEAIAKVEKYPAVRVAVYAGLASVLLPILGAPNAIIEWVKGTSTGKTRVLQVVQSIWRSPMTPLASWDNTISNFESKAHLFSGLPLFIDDTKLVTTAQGKRGEELLGKTIYKFVNGVGRGRDTRQGGQRASITWRSILFSTGEVPSSELAHAEGASARVLSFWTAPWGKSNPKTGAMIEKLIDIQLAENYGHAGPMFVEWLHTNRDKWALLRGAYDDVTSKVRDTFRSRAADRLARVIALLDVTAAAAHAAGIIPWEPRPLTNDPEIQALLRISVSQAESGANDAQRAWEHVLSEAESRASQWVTWGAEPKGSAEPHGGWLGWKSDEVLAWHPSQLTKTLESAGFNPGAIRRAWKERGMLEGGSAPHPYTKVIRVGGEPRRTIRVAYLILNESAWKSEDDASPSSETGDDENE